MTTKLFVNLPVEDLPASTKFYESIGYSVNPDFSDEHATCLVVSDTIFIMLLTTTFYREFTSKQIIDAKVATEFQLAVSTDSKDAVDEIHAKALAAGGTAAGAQDFGFMYSKSFEDLDGHHWDHMWMDPNAAANGPPEMTEEEMRAGIIKA